MIVIKARCESEELKTFRSLNLRMGLTGKDLHYYSFIEKGYEGECRFDRLVEAHLSDDWLAVNDLLLEKNNRMFQIDSLLVRHGTIFLNDVKNFDGDYYIKDGKWYTAFGNEVDDPLEQLRICESRLRRLLQSLGYPLAIESRLVFMNPNFYLYQAPLNSPIIFPTQLNRFMNYLQMKTGNINERDLKLAQKLVSLNIGKFPFSRFPEYSYEKLEKGIACTSFHSFMKVYNKETVICPLCGRKELIDSAVLRNIEELKMLFPDLKITTSVIQEWCNVIPTNKRIWIVLRKNFELVQRGRSSYYVKK